MKHLGAIPGTYEYRDAQLHPEAVAVESAVVIKAECALCFLNVEVGAPLLGCCCWGAAAGVLLLCRCCSVILLLLVQCGAP